MMTIMTLDIYSIINLFGVLNGVLFTAVFLRVRRGDRASNRVVAALMITLTFIAAGSFCSHAGYLARYPHLQKVFSPALFLLGPTLHRYVRRLLGERSRFRAAQFAHLVPALLNVVYNVPFYLKGNAEKVALLALGITPAVRVIRCLAFAHFTVYFILCRRDLRAGQAAAREQYASQAQIQVRWISRLGATFATVLLANIVPDLAPPMFSPLLAVWEALAILYLGYHGLTQPQLFLDLLERSETGKKSVPPLPAELQAGYAKRICEFMQREKPYLDPELTLSRFAERIGIPANQCSFIINRQFGLNFFHFVNRARVEECKRLLRDTRPTPTILSAALAAGFNSKSTFNSIFKQYEGITPSVYIARLQAGESPTLKN